MTMRLISVTIGDVHEGGSFNDSANIKLSEAGFFFESHLAFIAQIVPSCVPRLQ